MTTRHFGLIFFVMPGLVPGIHAFLRCKDVDGRVMPGHDENMSQR
jgi:hypothetical protein